MIIHQMLLKEDQVFYLCNEACGTTDEKLTIILEKVTCKNCLRKLKKQEKK